jgi:hypothetical protein
MVKKKLILSADIVDTDLYICVILADRLWDV